MDGTIIDSTEAVIKNWQRRSIDVLQIYEPKLANWEYSISNDMLINDKDICHAEGLIPKEFGQDAVEIPGSRVMLEKLEQQVVPWAIVTSGTQPLVSGWLDVMQLAHPKNLVTAEDVDNGKPDPACYRLGAKKLGLQMQQPLIIVFEDAPAGVRSGKAAGYTVVALNTTHTLDQLVEAGADYIVQDMRSVSLKSWNPTTGEGELEIANALV
ncbi:DL-glycerol-3-phosphatase [Neocucurbitaria cava]|uniref:DL-glycerol-3-phosphatase n=1 Tax=Neocucurbitaria cava TaxID=798079 RepID=A0A9W8Y415_9PLEO|nr:DL-glycerol-3-phosphatase [Neocucurbitaria cava]